MEDLKVRIRQRAIELSSLNNLEDSFYDDVSYDDSQSETEEEEMLIKLNKLDQKIQIG